MKRTAALVLLLLVTCVATATEFMGYPVIEKPFRTAGGKILMLPVTDAGAVPAETPEIRIEEAGLLLSRSKDEWQLPAVVWQFGFENKSLGRIESVSIERVAPDDPASPVLVDDHGVGNGQHWTGSAEPVAASPASSPWLYEEGDSIFVFRFDIIPTSGKKVTLYQPVWYSAKAKSGLRKALGAWQGKH